MPFPPQRCCYIAPRDTTPRVIVSKDIVARKNSSPLLLTVLPSLEQWLLGIMSLNLFLSI